MNNNKPSNPLVVTPFGYISYPYLAQPVPTGRGQHDEGKYKCSLYIAKKDLQTPDGQKLLLAVLEVGRKGKGNPNLKLADFNNPFGARYDVDRLPPEKRAKTPEIVREGFFHVPAKLHKGRPAMLGPDKKILTEEQIADIKAGDIGRFIVQPYWYGKGETGVALGLDTVQFKQKGKPFGREAGDQAQVLLDAIEVKVEDIQVSGSGPTISADSGALAVG